MDSSLYHLLLWVASGIFSIAFLITGYRLILGPNSLDRLITLDAFVAMIQCALATYICFSIDTTVTSAMLVVALLGFISTIAATRFRKKDDAQ